jgi:hypothetical protein
MKKIFLTVFVALSLAGCATSVRYISYTQEKLSPKSKYYYMNVYSVNQKVPESQVYRIIGKVEVKGNVSNGVTPDMLLEQAKNTARKKGADAIINVETKTMTNTSMYVTPGHYGYYHYHPATYVPYQNTFLDFTGELVVYGSR